MADYKVTDTELTGIANAIRTKSGTSEQLMFPNGFTSAINAIPTGGSGRQYARGITLVEQIENPITSAKEGQ